MSGLVSDLGEKIWGHHPKPAKLRIAELEISELGISNYWGGRERVESWQLGLGFGITELGISDYLKLQIRYFRYNSIIKMI